MPDSMKKVWASSDQCEPREGQKKVLKIYCFDWWWQMTNLFWHILEVLSTLDDLIKLNPFPLSQASWDTSLEYQQGVLWITLKLYSNVIEHQKGELTHPNVAWQVGITLPVYISAVSKYVSFWVQKLIHYNSFWFYSLPPPETGLLRQFMGQESDLMDQILDQIKDPGTDGKIS